MTDTKISVPQDEYELKSNTCKQTSVVLDIIEDILKSDITNLDIYQVLAFRKLDKKSHNNHPFERYPWLLFFSYYQSLRFACVVVGLLQVLGLSVTVYIVVRGYFNDLDKRVSSNAQCEWEFEAWMELGHFKLLAFLLSSLISFFACTCISDLPQNGLYRLLKNDEHYEQFSTFINLSILQMSILIHHYVLLVAVCGSFFLIYASESTDATDMIVNAIALFFMVQADDMLVSSKDAIDLRSRFERYRKEYQQSEVEESTADGEIRSKCSKKCWIKWSAGICCFLRMAVYFFALVSPFAITICW